MRERGTIVTFIQKEKQDIDCIKSMITQTKGGDEIYLDRIQQRVQQTEQNMKNFKLKSRQTYQTLVDSEQTMMAELSALEDKFDAWVSEGPSEEVTNIMKR